MNFAQQFLAIKNVLESTQPLWSKEMLEHYPANLPSPWDEWGEHLQQYTHAELVQFENHYTLRSNAPASFLSFAQHLKELSSVPALRPVYQVEHWGHSQRGITPKKKHELERLAGVYPIPSGSSIVDIGGGVGHLSQFMVEQFQVRSDLYEMDPKLIDTGKKRMARYFPLASAEVQWHFEKVDQHTSISTKNAYIIGLHSCGPLSVQVLNLIDQTERGISVGCCYHKMISEYNLSTISKKSPLHLSNHALTLAAKCHRIVDVSDIENRYRVKHHRYLLHLFLYHQMNQNQFQEVGNAPAHLYQQDLASYIHHYQLDGGFSAEAINQFATEFKTSFEGIFYRGFLRSMFGRLIELYLILDRTLWLQERLPAKKIVMGEIFDREHSPRNLAILTS